MTGLEAKLVSAEAANRSLSNRVAAYSETKAVLEDELDKELVHDGDDGGVLLLKQ